MNPRLVLSIAYRYLRGKRAGNAVPILSRISMTAIAVGAGALIIIFSVFNGFEGLVADLYKAFYPSIRITPKEGKFFRFSPQQWTALRSVPGITAATGVLEDNVLANSEDEQLVLTLKGIDNSYFRVNEVKPYIIDGADTVSSYPAPTALIGEQVAVRMGINIDNVFSRLQLYYPNSEGALLPSDLANAFQSLTLQPGGVFKVQDEFDSKFILAPIDEAGSLLLRPGFYSSIELKTAPEDEERIREILRGQLGKSFRVETRFEQNRTMYLVMRSEKWAVYIILLLVLLIASFNMVGGLSMLVLEKQKDMAILRAMGARTATIRGIFMAEGILWSLTGGLIGLFLGGLLCWGQQRFGWMKLQGNFIIEAYPVSLQAGDFLVVIGTVVLIGLLASWYPSWKATKTESYWLRTD